VRAAPTSWIAFVAAGFACPVGSVAADAAHEVIDSSLARFIDALASAIEARVAGPFALRIDITPGLDAALAARTVRSHLTTRLQRGGRAAPDSTAARTVALTVSTERGAVWAVGLIDGPGLDGPLGLAATEPLDRELSVLLGARGTADPGGRWSMDRLGPIDGPVLDLGATDADGDGRDEIVVLLADAVASWRLGALSSAPERWASAALPAATWPRLRVGWLAAWGRRVFLADTAGRSLAVVLAPDGFSSLTETAGVPLRQVSPNAPRVVSLDRGPLLRDGPEGSRRRDAVALPDGGSAWVDEAGELHADPWFAGTRMRVGDRLLVCDLDGDGRVELIATEPSAPGEPDAVTVHTLLPGGGTSIAFRGPLAGSVAALVDADLDFDGRREVVVAEEDEGRTMLWTLGRSR
jgi:hypothetical protein